ncbi:MAG: hypothetical protein Q7J44_06635 [Pseudotabrizicola sp.]|jgi:hypothetical protein|uniref:hypothetical protein n=1 Tax=Pseudotabrizicola sp. TaxID=2939647 RepID=UPI00271A6C85|nr:hypothetical protein [Pseudotabrizicola sp.]MDO9638200.1 hypothetical protein [Pseudotabrizicola sp.]
MQDAVAAGQRCAVHQADHRDVAAQAVVESRGVAGVGQLQVAEGIGALDIDAAGVPLQCDEPGTSRPSARPST